MRMGRGIKLDFKNWSQTQNEFAGSSDVEKAQSPFLGKKWFARSTPWLEVF